MINLKIIRAYDIRGIYKQTLFEQDALLIGWSLARYLKNLDSKPKTVSVCRDGRLSSPALSSALIEGLLTGGVDVMDIGVGPTPMLYFSNFTEPVDAGVMITGSHNPSDYNGFKFIVNRKPFFGDQLQHLQQISREYPYKEPTNKAKHGLARHTIITEQYVEMLAGVVKNLKGFKIAWDPGNGAASEIIKKLTERIPGEHIVLNSTIDGTFPAHHPDPTVLKNLEQIISTVLEHGCDFGIAFDGDGDRIGLVDNLGRVVYGDQILILLAQEILKFHPGATIIADVKASQIFFDQIKKHGGQAVMWKTGHSHIKQHMKDTGALLAGEMSGHIFIADAYYGYDDALYAAVRLIKLLRAQEAKLSDIIDQLPQSYSTPEIRIECREDQKFAIVENLKIYFQQHKIKFNDIDGIRYSWKSGWGLIRASNTQNVLVCRFEAASSKEIEEQKNLIAHLLAPYNLALPN